MGTSPSNPHDTYFKHVFARPADAASELSLVLPKQVVSQVDWNSLEVCKDTFVSAELRERRSDILFRARIDGHEAFIYVVVEHQSRVDRFMSYRMLEYMVNIWDHYLKTNPNARQLPMVIPLVVYASRKHGRWNAPLDIAGLLDTGPHADIFADYLPRFRYLVDDLTAIELDALLARPLSSPIMVMFFLLKIAPGNEHIDKFLPLIREHQRKMFAGPHGTADLTASWTYIMETGKTPPEEVEPELDLLGPEAKEAIMTGADMLRAEGEARGEARGRAATLLEQLELKFGDVSESVRIRVGAAGLDELKTWTARVLTAGNIESVFR